MGVPFLLSPFGGFRFSASQNCGRVLRGRLQIANFVATRIATLQACVWASLIYGAFYWAHAKNANFSGRWVWSYILFASGLEYRWQTWVSGFMDATDATHGELGKVRAV